MTDRIVRPIRAWAEYDEWSVYLQQWDAEYWDVVFTPNGDDDWAYSRKEFSGIADFVQGSAGADMTVHVGPLRSLRVLYENGYEMELDADDGPFPGEWEWLVLGPGETYQASGSFKEDKDSEAVERAMIAASAWFTQADPATLGIDSPPPEPAS
jgi:hypothetical protein